MPDYTLDNTHWTLEHHVQRMTTKQWKYHLLKGEDTMFAKGIQRQLIAKKLGYGVVEISKKPVDD